MYNTAVPVSALFFHQYAVVHIISVQIKHKQNAKLLFYNTTGQQSATRECANVTTHGHIQIQQHMYRCFFVFSQCYVRAKLTYKTQTEAIQLYQYTGHKWLCSLTARADIRFILLSLHCLLMFSSWLSNVTTSQEDLWVRKERVCEFFIMHFHNDIVKVSFNGRSKGLSSNRVRAQFV